MRDALARFVSDVFASTQFDQQILLRGVYFTSGTQSGTPVDRLLSGIGRRFNVAPSAIVRSSGPGKAYFIERLLKEVLIGESGLAGVNRKVETRKAAAQIGAYAAMALAAIFGVVFCLSVTAVTALSSHRPEQTSPRCSRCRRCRPRPRRKRLSRASMPSMPLWLRPTIIALTRRG